MPISQASITLAKKHGYRPGYNYFACAIGSISNITLSANIIRYCPFTITEDITIDRLSTEIVGGASGALIKLGIYKPSTVLKGVPGSLIISTAFLDSSTIGIKNGSISDTLIPAGDYWSATITNSSSISVRGCNNVPLPTEYLVGTTEEAFNLISSSYMQSGASDLPSTVVAANISQNRVVPLMKFRVKS